jgi:hypothetical protein
MEPVRGAGEAEAGTTGSATDRLKRLTDLLGGGRSHASSKRRERGCLCCKTL